jgi:hypothetical protein
MSDDASALIGLVQSIEDALTEVRGRHKQLGISLVRAELSLKVETKKVAGLDIDLKIVPVEIGGSAEWTSAQTFELDLTPVGSAGDLGAKVVTDELARGIIAMASAASKINDLHRKTWNVGEMKVLVEFGVEKSGKIKVFVGGEGASNRAHSIALTFIKT